MKNKILTYVLLLSAVTVWGLIIYRLVNASDSGNYTNATEDPIAIRSRLEVLAETNDTSSLLLNYRDPFGIEPPPDEIKPKVTTQKTSVKKPLKPAAESITVKFTGYIHLVGNKKLLALMNINGKDVMMNERDIVDKVKLIKNLRDCVMVSINNRPKFITIKH